MAQWDCRVEEKRRIRTWGAVLVSCMLALQWPLVVLFNVRGSARVAFHAGRPKARFIGQIDLKCVNLCPDKRVGGKNLCTAGDLPDVPLMRSNERSLPASPRLPFADANTWLGRPVRYSQRFFEESGEQTADISEVMFRGFLPASVTMLALSRRSNTRSNRVFGHFSGVTLADSGENR